MTKDMFEYEGISKDRLDDILSKIPKLNIALIGDICLDVYWHADMTKSALSRETPHFPLPIVAERMSPGAGGNVASNISALGVKNLNVLSVIGDDWRGAALKSTLSERKIVTGVLISSRNVITNAYCKPLRQGVSETIYEDPRLDFTNYEPLPESEEDRLIKTLERAAKEADAICVCDQFLYGCITKKIRDKISELGKSGLIIVADSRDRVNLYKNITIKPNEIEGGVAAFGDFDPASATFDDYKKAAELLCEKTGNNVCMTLGELGCVYAQKEGLSYIPTKKAISPIDICGAGDTFLSAFTCALAAGAKGYEAVSFANIASSVTIKKINMTGVASPDEIKAKHEKIS